MVTPRGILWVASEGAHDGALSSGLKRQLMSIFVNRGLPDKVREDAIEVLSVKAAESEFSPFLDDLVRVARLKSESPTIRAGALMGLHLVAKGSKDNSTLSSLFTDILNDRTELGAIRFYAGNALSQTSRDIDKVFALLTAIVSSRDESAEPRLQLMKLAVLTTVAAPERCEAFISVLRRVAVDENESVHIRVGALEVVAELLLNAQIERIDIDLTSRTSSRELIRLLLDGTAPPRVRDAAGYALTVCPAVDAGAIPELIDVLSGDDRFAHEYAIHALCRLGSRAKPSVSQLIRIWNDQHATEGTREAAKEALLAIDPEGARGLGLKEGAN